MLNYPVSWRIDLRENSWTTLFTKGLDKKGLKEEDWMDRKKGPGFKLEEKELKDWSSLKRGVFPFIVESFYFSLSIFSSVYCMYKGVTLKMRLLSFELYLWEYNQISCPYLWKCNWNCLFKTKLDFWKRGPTGYTPVT